jgi:hypothetical protein
MGEYLESGSREIFGQATADYHQSLSGLAANPDCIFHLPPPRLQIALCFTDSILLESGPSRNLRIFAGPYPGELILMQEKVPKNSSDPN